MSRVHFSPPPSDDGPRRALILAGGGIRVAYQVGVLRALDEAGLRFAHGDGTSGGTMNLAMLFSGQSPEEMADRWRTLDVRGFAGLLPFRDYASLQPRAMGSASGLTDNVFPHLGIDVDTIRQAEGMEGTFNVCNYTRKTVEAMPHTALTEPLLVAGVSLPMVMPAVEHDGQTWIDAVWIKDANCWEAVHRGADELWVVWCIGNTAAYRRGLFEQYVHMIEMSANGALFEEFDRIRDLNARIEAGDSPFGQRRPVCLHVIRPEHPLPLDPDFFFGRITADELMAHGYADAYRYLRARTDAGVPLTPDATAMTTSRAGIRFRETMKGYFALGETDPQAGREAGEEADTTLALHASIAIPDVERFAEDPAHEGEITGTVDFAPLGEGLIGTHGRFNLFSPTGEPDHKRMVYELGFRHGDDAYYLAGYKDVHDDPGFDLWSDTTTLYTRLHRGTDTTGPVAGAGVLSLGVGDLARLVSTIQTTDADGPADKARAIAAFGRFFMGELWDSYGRHAVAQD